MYNINISIININDSPSHLHMLLLDKSNAALKAKLYMLKVARKRLLETIHPFNVKGILCGLKYGNGENKKKKKIFVLYIYSVMHLVFAVASPEG